MTAHQRIPAPRSFAAFWPYYLGEHRNPLNRALHCLGTGLALLLVVAGLLGDARLLVAAPLVGYGCAWLGHYLVERNRPATFRHPLWSLMADLRLFALVLQGRWRDTAVDDAGPGKP